MLHLGNKTKLWQIVTVWYCPAGVVDYWYLYSSNSKLSQSMKIPTVTINKRKLKDRRVSIYLSYRPAITDPIKKKDHAFETLGVYLWDKPRNESRKSLTSRQCCESRVSRLNELSPLSTTNLTSSMPKREAETFYYSLVNFALADLPCTEAV